MATRQKPLTRSQLAEFLPNHEAIKAFENLLKDVGISIPNNLEEVLLQAISAQNQASQALSTAISAEEKAFFAALSPPPLNPVPVNVPRVDVWDDNDLPPAIGGRIFLEAKHYVLQQSYSSDKSLAFREGPDAQCFWDSENFFVRTYTGTGAHIDDPAMNGSIEVRTTELHAPNGAIFNCILSSDPGALASVQFSSSGRCRNCRRLGYIETVDVNWHFGSITGFSDGLIAHNMFFHEVNTMFVRGNDCAKLDYDGQLAPFSVDEEIEDQATGATATVEWDYNGGTSGTLVLSNVNGTFGNNNQILGDQGGDALVDGQLYRVRFFSVTGDQTFGPINYLLVSCDPRDFGALFYFDPEIQTNVDGILIREIQQYGAFTGVNFDDNSLKPSLKNSLTQEDVKVKAYGNQVLPDSTAIAATSILANTLQTTYSAPNTPTRINTIWEPLRTPERIVYRDNCTFDGATDVITAFNTLSGAAFNHGLANGNRVTFVANGGLPTGISQNTDYYVINVTATTFQISLTPGGAAVNFTGNGTAPNYYQHRQGTSATGWMIYVGLVTEKFIITGWISMDKTTGTTVSARSILMKTTGFTPVQELPGSTLSVKNGEVQSSDVDGTFTLSTDQGVIIYSENRSNIDQLRHQDAFATLRKT